MTFKITQLQRATAANKPLDEQISNLQAVKACKSQRISKLVDTALAASLERAKLSEETGSLQAEIQRLKTARLAELNIAPQLPGKQRMAAERAAAFA